MVRAMVKLAMVAAVVAAAFCGSSTAQAASKASLAGTAWVTPIKKDGATTGALLMAFGDDDDFILVVFNRDGETLKKVKGTYTFRNNMLKLTVDDKPFAREEVTEFGRSAMVTEDHNGKETHWKRYIPKKSRSGDDD